MVDYNPLDSRFLTTSNSITRNGQKFVRIILDTVDNVFYTLDDDGNFNPIGSGGTASSGVTSINTSTGISGNTTTGAVTIINTLPDLTVSISGGTGITTGGVYPNFTVLNSAPDQTVTITGGTDVTIEGTYPNFGVNLIGTTIKDNVWGSLNGSSSTLTGLTVNDWFLYDGSWTRLVFDSRLKVSTGPTNFNFEDPIVDSVLMFNVTGEYTATANHAVEVGWSYNDVTGPNISGSTQSEHLRSGVPVGIINCNFFVEIFQGQNDFYLFFRNLTDGTNISVTNINVVITTVYSLNA